MKPETLIWQRPESPPPSSDAPPEELPLLLLPEPELPPASGGCGLELLEEHATATPPARDTAITPNHLLGDMRFLLLSTLPCVHARGPQRAHPICSPIPEKPLVCGS
jgi:hypothetical protein